MPDVIRRGRTLDDGRESFFQIGNAPGRERLPAFRAHAVIATDGLWHHAIASRED